MMPVPLATPACTVFLGMMQVMVPEVLRYKIPFARSDEFERAWGEAGRVLMRSAHCHGFELLRSRKDPELYLLLIRWDSAEGHLQGFRQSAEFQEFLIHIRQFLPELLEMEHYSATGIEWDRSP